MKRSSSSSVKLNKSTIAVIAVVVLASIAAIFFLKDIPFPGGVPGAGSATANGGASEPVSALGVTPGDGGSETDSASSADSTLLSEAGASTSADSDGTTKAGTTSTGGSMGTSDGSGGLSASVIPDEAWSRDIAAKGYKDGAPIGGLGAGSITWQYDGNFYNGRLIIGNNNMDTDGNCGFYMFQKPGGGNASSFRLDSGSLKSGQAEYYSLFPKSWVDYYGDKFVCKARVTQFSPLIPEDYKLSSYPAGVYKWELSNPTQEKCEVSVMFTWRNSFGGKAVVPVKDESGRFSGIKLVASGNAPASDSCEFSIGCEKAEGMEITYTSSNDHKKIQRDFSDDGMLNNMTGEGQTGALCVTTELEPGEVLIFPMALTWDMPVYKGNEGNDWYKEYTRYFGRDGGNSWDIALEALQNAGQWEDKIDSWQSSILEDTKYPDWLKTTLFNELYYYTIGGTVWEAGAASGQQDDPGEDMFSSLECFEYPFYGTSDVRFYGSWALVQLWPEI